VQAAVEHENLRALVKSSGTGRAGSAPGNAANHQNPFLVRHHCFDQDVGNRRSLPDAPRPEPVRIASLVD